MPIRQVNKIGFAYLDTTSCDVGSASVRNVYLVMMVSSYDLNKCEYFYLQIFGTSTSILRIEIQHKNDIKDSNCSLR